MENKEQHSQEPKPAFAEEPPTPGWKGPEKHSGFGIAATVLGIITIILAMTGMGMALTNQELIASFDGDVADPLNLTAEEQEVIMVIGLIGLCFMGAALLTLIGIILGLIGLFNKQRKKLYSVLGTVLSSTPLILYLFYSTLMTVMR